MSITITCPIGGNGKHVVAQRLGKKLRIAHVENKFLAMVLESEWRKQDYSAEPGRIIEFPTHKVQ